MNHERHISHQEVVFFDTNNPIPIEEREGIETLFDQAFEKKPNEIDSFTGILDKRPGDVIVIKNFETGQILHASIFNHIHRKHKKRDILYHSVAATHPDQQGKSIGKQALIEMINRIHTPCIILARTQNPMEVGSFRQASQKLGLGENAVSPIFKNPTPIEIEALQDLINVNESHGSKTIWKSTPDDVASFIARGAYSRLSQPNMIAHLEKTLDWEKKTASAMSTFLQQNCLNINHGDAIFIGFTLEKGE